MSFSKVDFSGLQKSSSMVLRSLDRTSGCTVRQTVVEGPAADVRGPARQRLKCDQGSHSGEASRASKSGHIYIDAHLGDRLGTFARRSDSRRTRLTDRQFRGTYSCTAEFRTLRTMKAAQVCAASMPRWRLRKLLGVSPLARANCRLNSDRLVKPTSAAIVAIGIAVSINIEQARPIRSRLM